MGFPGERTVQTCESQRIRPFCAPIGTVLDGDAGSRRAMNAALSNPRSGAAEAAATTTGSLANCARPFGAVIGHGSLSGTVRSSSGSHDQCGARIETGAGASKRAVTFHAPRSRRRCLRASPRRRTLGRCCLGFQPGVDGSGRIRSEGGELLEAQPHPRSSAQPKRPRRGTKVQSSTSS